MHHSSPAVRSRHVQIAAKLAIDSSAPVYVFGRIQSWIAS